MCKPPPAESMPTTTPDRGEIIFCRVNTKNEIKVGYEHGCPGAATHIALRFRDQPTFALDGKLFPCDLWEKSTYYIAVDYPIKVCGLSDIELPIFTLGTKPLEIKKKEPNLGNWAEQLDLLRKNYPELQQVPTRADLSLQDMLTTFMELSRQCLDDINTMSQWIAAYKKSMRASKVSAQWFVIHDTGDSGNNGYPSPANYGNAGDSGVCLFVGWEKKHGILLHRDYSNAGSATKFEQIHTEFRGKMIHVELLGHSSSIEQRNPPDLYTDFQYKILALSYINASYRAERWLTVTAHIEVDRGIDGAHSCPRGINLNKLYDMISSMVGLSQGASFGILNARIGDGYNERDYVNTFPAQYGPVRKEAELKKRC